VRRITLWLLSTISALVLLLSYPTSLPTRVGTSQVVTADAPGGTGSGATGGTGSSGLAGGAGGGGSSGSSSGSSGGGGGAGGGTGSATPEATPAPAPRTLTGDSVATPYGPVEVQVTVTGDQVTDVHVLQVPWDNGQDRQVNGYAVPILVEETTAADSAHIDMVSGATYTSGAYIESLQSALDQL
jgi:hypothetical protein